MKKLFLLLLLPALAQAGVQAQSEPQADTGVHFEHGLSWADVQAKAKAENKYIFMDCFTTWCGPCRYMSTTIFPQKETGDYMNDKFVSVAVQLDTTAKDAPAVKAWYADGHDLAAKYGIRAYPTYMIFAPDGRPVHRLVGSRLDAKTFIKDLATAFDSTQQYYTLLEEYNNGRRDTAFLHRMAMGCLNAYDVSNGQKVAADWLGTQDDHFTRDALYLEDMYTRRSDDKYFTVFTDHAGEVDKVLGPGVAEQKVRSVYMMEGLNRKPGDNRPPDWKALHRKIAARMPAAADELTERIKIDYYQRRSDWPNFQKAIVTYMKSYGGHMSDAELNQIAWGVFQKCPDMSCVSDVLNWSKRLKDNKEPAFMDTYANILYKLGKKDEAIALETRAADMAAAGEKAGYEATIEKMKKGEKTWD